MAYNFHLILMKIFRVQLNTKYQCIIEENDYRNLLLGVYRGVLYKTKLR